MAAVLKTARRKPRGFESLPLRFTPCPRMAGGLICEQVMERMHTHLWLRRGDPRRGVMVGLALILAALLGTACDIGTSGAGTSPGGATPPPVPTALVRGE